MNHCVSKSWLKGSALPYTLAVCLLVGVLLSSMVLLFGYTKVANDRAWFRELAHDNLESGMNLVLYGKGPKLGYVNGQLFDSGLDSFYVNSGTWGMYGLMQVVGVHGPARDSAAYLFGMEPEGEFAASLFLGDQNRPLALAGSTRIEGICYLPEAGVKRGIVGRTGYIGNELVYGERRKSKGRQLKAGFSMLQEMQRLLKQVYAGQLPAGNADLVEGKRLHGDWNKLPRTIVGGSALYLGGVDLSGKTLVAAPEIWVSRDAKLEHTVLLGQSIFFEDGFEGKVQAFASDTIEVGDSCTFSYPSCLLASHPESFSQLRIGKHCELEGMVVHDASFVGGQAKKDSYTLIDSASTVYGNVWVPYNLDLKGAVQGNTVTNNFFLRLPGSLYENHLLDATISQAGLSSRYAMGFLKNTPSRYRMIQRLK